ncbi:hypothetical protein ACI8AF_24990 [Blastococcus sp. SYSU D00669]
MSDHCNPRSWWADESDRLQRELAAMHQAAPGLRWLTADEEPSGGWTGPVPLWPFDRPAPSGLSALVAGQPLQVRIKCGHAFPMVEPAVYPLNVDLPNVAFGWTSWHVLPDSALCLLQDASLWDPRAAAAELVPKISGWYLEYQLLSRGLVEAMTMSGIVTDDSQDRLLAEAGAACS